MPCSVLTLTILESVNPHLVLLLSLTFGSVKHSLILYI
jgi:hypothetical protein